MSSRYLATAIAFEICGTTSLKLSDGFVRPAPAAVVAAIGILWFGRIARRLAALVPRR